MMSIAIVDTTDIAEGLAVLEKIKPRLEALASRGMASESTQDLVNDQLHTIALEIALEKRLERTAVAQIHEAIAELFVAEYYEGDYIQSRELMKAEERLPAPYLYSSLRSVLRAIMEDAREGVKGAEAGAIDVEEVVEFDEAVAFAVEEAEEFEEGEDAA